MNPIEISSIIPIGMNEKQAIKLAENLAKTMRSMWSAEGGPIKLKQRDFAYTALNYCGTPEVKTFLADRIQNIFTEKVLSKIIKSKNEVVNFTFNGKNITINSKNPEPA